MRIAVAARPGPRLGRIFVAVELVENTVGAEVAFARSQTSEVADSHLPSLETVVD